MLAKLRARLTYANVVATLALFVALGGSSYAAIKITGKNVKNSSLSGRDIKNNSVTGRDVKSIKSADVTDRSLLAKDFKSGQLPAGPKGDTGPVGPTAGASAGNYDDPPAGANFVLEQAGIDMPTAGRIYAQGSLRSMTATCLFTSATNGAGGNCNLVVGLYVDGQPVPRSGRSTGGASCGSTGTTANCNTSSADHDWSLFGVSAPVPAGHHNVQLSALIAAAPNGQSTATLSQIHKGIVGGIALGG